MEEEGENSEDDEQNIRAWGDKKNQFYKEGDEDSDSDREEDEEEEAKLM